MRRLLTLRVGAAALAVVPIVVWVLPAPPAHAAVTAQRVAGGLAFPAGFTVAGGRILYGERFTGQIRILSLQTGSNTLLFTVPNIATSGEQGLLGVEVHPNYPSTPYVYAYATRALATGTVNQIVRITDAGGTGTDFRVLLTLPAGEVHNGGRILFGPDGHLYAAVGENGVRARSQDPSTLAGKVIRMTESGGVPSRNPVAGSYVYVSGIRNSFGLTFDPTTSRPWATDNGPECNDELNRIIPGRNYGWGPNATCSTPPSPPANTNRDGPSPIFPVRYWTQPIAPTGVAFCAGCGLGTAVAGALLMGDFNTGTIRRFNLDADRVRIVSSGIVYDHTAGVLALEAGGDGALYFSDSGAIYRLAFT